MKGYHKCRDWDYKGNESCNNRPCPIGLKTGTCMIKNKSKRKPRSKTVKVKAWAFQYRDRYGLLKWYASEHKSTMPIKNVTCHIVFNRKHLKEEK